MVIQGLRTLYHQARQPENIGGSSVPFFNHKGVEHQLFAVRTYGSVEIYFQWYQRKAPSDAEGKRRELLGRLNAIEGVSLGEEAITRRPGIPLAAFRNEATLRQLLDAFDWVIQEIRGL